MTKKSQASSSSRRPKVSQSDFPIFTLEQSLKLPQALWDEFAGTGAAPHQVAIALDRAPTSGDWRNLCGSALAYGLVDGGYNATKMTLTPLGRRIVAPTSEGDDMAARVESVLQSSIMNAFLRKYDRGKFPSNTIAENVLIELGLPKDRAKAAREVLEKNARYVGIIKDTKTGPFVALDDVSSSLPVATTPAGSTSDASPLRRPPGEDPPADSSSATDTRRGGPSRAPAAPATQALSRNMVVDCYRLKQRLGSGFSAEVWSASVNRVPPGSELQKGDSVAVKFYYAHAMALPDQVLRVEREYRIAQSLRHDNLIRIHEFVLASPRPNHNFLVMDLARGKPLKTLIEKKELSPKQVLQVYHQVLSALDELHNAGALHRDVKPGNISVEVSDGGTHATLLDLGIVTITYEKGVTAVSHFLGSKHWAPLEQLMGHSLDERSDLYSAAAVAYNGLTGQDPYAGSQTEAAVAVSMQNAPLKVPALRDVPDEVLNVLNACLSHRRDDRPATARDCLDVIERHI